MGGKPNIDLQQLRFFPGERMLRTGRTLLRFPKPRARKFVIYLMGDVLPNDEADRVAAPLLYYHSSTRCQDELSDDEQSTGPSLTLVTQDLSAQDPDTPAS